MIQLCLTGAFYLCKHVGRQMLAQRSGSIILSATTDALIGVAGLDSYTAALTYNDQPGALNEHFSDVFGILVKQHSLKQTASKPDWLSGAGIFTKRVHGVAIRSMKAPGTAYDDPLLGKDPQPAHMRDYKRSRSDNGGVHINSGIPNHAFYLAATGLGGKAWEVAGRIWYAALTAKLSPRAQFVDCADATFEAAGNLFGIGSAPQQAVAGAWEAGGGPGGPRPRRSAPCPPCRRVGAIWNAGPRSWPPSGRRRRTRPSSTP